MHPSIEGSVEVWLRTRSFKCQRDAKNPTLVGLSIANQSLEDTARGRLTGFIVNDSIIVDNMGKVRINWGVRQYPEEASDGRGVSNGGLMLYFFFSKEKVSSGRILIPDSPYCIGLFLCQAEKVNFSYKGGFFHPGGRFACLGKPKSGEMVVSEFELDSAFKRYFDKRQTPAITNIALGVDTSRAGGSDQDAAFIKSIVFLENRGNTSSDGLQQHSGITDARPLSLRLKQPFLSLSSRADRELLDRKASSRAKFPHLGSAHSTFIAGWANYR